MVLDGFGWEMMDGYGPLWMVFVEGKSDEN